MNENTSVAALNTAADPRGRLEDGLLEAFASRTRAGVRLAVPVLAARKKLTDGRANDYSVVRNDSEA